MTDIRPDFCDVPRIHQPTIDAIASLVAAGAAGACLIGPPGMGATMIARRVPGLLSPLTDHATRWLQAEYSALGYWPGLIEGPPLRAPHHSCSVHALCGSLRRDPRHCHAGELHLARFGVLFLDELPEFRLQAVQSLAWDCEGMAGRPFIMASAHPCPCGWRGHDDYRRCTCSERAIAVYQRHVTDYCNRLGLTQITVAPATHRDMLREGPRCDSTADVRARIEAA